jgi:hypothetical protein
MGCLERKHTIVFKWLAFRLHTLPLQPLTNNEIHDTAILLLKMMRKLAVPPQFTGQTMEFVDPVFPWQQPSAPK